MSSRRIRSIRVDTFALDAPEPTRRFRPDEVIVEEPLELRCDGESFSVTMRTPGNDQDWALGFLHSEGVIESRRDVVGLRYCGGRDAEGIQHYNVLDATLARSVGDTWRTRRRTTLTSSACGLCGTTQLDDLAQRVRYPPETTPIPIEALATAVARLGDHQPLFDRTGGIHAAALVNLDGEVLVAREDIGRHNAVDKVIGWALRQDRLPLRSTIVAVSSRASFELAQKAALAGATALVAVSAPSSPAIDVARRHGMILAGFVRAGRANVYAGADRVVGPQGVIS